eukprot:6931922-Karenia_brevis.AAC.1
MLSKLVSLPNARGMLPFVRLAYGQPIAYAWEDAKRRRRARRAFDASPVLPGHPRGLGGGEGPLAR